jgi:Transposase DDE domain
MGGIEVLAAAISADLQGRLPGQRKTQREKLALLVATMLDVRSANLMDLAASLPRPAEQLAMRYQWIKRLLANALVDSDAVMAPYGREMLARLAGGGARLVLLIDQTQATERHQAVMVAVRVGGRALPLAWRVKETQGAIGFAEQRQALDTVAALLPAGTTPVLMGDRFYGGPDLIAWCRSQGWHWRLRLKQDLLVFEDGGETTLGECFANGQHMLTGIGLTAKRVLTNVAMVHEAGHPEPWIIALSEAPSVHRAFDYGLRWGIEAMFSDFKTRGFGIEDSHIRLPRRLDHLILVMALALYWAVSTGMWDAANRPTTAEKKPRIRGRETMPEPSLPSSPGASGVSRCACNASGQFLRSGALGQTDSW